MCTNNTVITNNTFRVLLVNSMSVSHILLPTAGILALLDEPELEVKVFALQRLNDLVDSFWAEIAGKVTEL